MKLLFYKFETQAQSTIFPRVTYDFECTYFIGVCYVGSYTGAGVVVAYAHYAQRVACVLGKFAEVNALWNTVAVAVLYCHRQILCYHAVYLRLNSCYLFLTWCGGKQVVALTFLTLDMCVAASLAAEHSYHRLVKYVLDGVHWRVLRLVVFV